MHRYRGYILHYLEFIRYLLLYYLKMQIEKLRIISVHNVEVIIKNTKINFKGDIYYDKQQHSFTGN